MLVANTLNWCYTSPLMALSSFTQVTRLKVSTSNHYYWIYICVRTFSCLRMRFFYLGFFQNAINWIPLLWASWHPHNSGCNVGITHLCLTFGMGWVSLWINGVTINRHGIMLQTSSDRAKKSLVVCSYKLTQIIALHTLSPECYDCSLSHYLHIWKYNPNYVLAWGSFLTFAHSCYD
jgi:hypothetical protein